ncbi:MAG: hypothetical protein FGM24_06250 [Candidatus Kapabacteria bacterium]|nr:hypothetical protein [Candidatus Kapabacteria bacterium]
MKRLVAPAVLRAWAMDVADISDWLFDECVRHVGSVSAAIALIVHSDDAWSNVSDEDLVERIAAMQTSTAADRKHFVLDHWQHLPMLQRVTFTRLCLTGSRPQRQRPEPEPWIELAQPLVLQTVLLHAHVIDRRIDAFTLGIWRRHELVPLVRMDRHQHPCIDAEGLDDYVIANTTERVGPIRAVPPQIVIQISIDTWRSAPRRKCGIDVRSAVYVRTLSGVNPKAASSVADLPMLVVP